MKLVWIAQDLHIGGGQRVICELSGRLVQRGHQVEILYPQGRGGFSVPEGVSTRAVGLKIDSSIGSIVVNFPFFVAQAPVCDWLLCSMPISALAGFAASRLRQARMLYYIMNDERILFDDRSLVQSDLLLGMYRQITDWAHGLPVQIAVNSQWTGNRVRRGRGYGYPVVPHGINPEIFQPEGETAERSDLPLIVTVGRRHRWKGLDDLIDALNLIKDECAFELRIISQDQLDLGRCQFPARVDKPTSDQEIAALLRAADLMVHPSWFEGFGLPPLEAMACGTATVITDCGGVREFAVDGENCRLTPIRDPRSLADAIKELLGDEKQRERLAQNGVKTAIKFTWDHATDLFEQILIDSA